jgi:hypothetical protein
MRLSLLEVIDKGRGDDGQISRHNNSPKPLDNIEMAIQVQ